MKGLHFYLEHRKDKEGKAITTDCPVIISLAFSPGRLKIYTGRKVSFVEWDKSSERIKNIYARADEFNSYLDMLEEKINLHFPHFKYYGQINDPAQFRESIKKLVKSEVPSFFGLLLRFIEEHNSLWSTSTYKKMKTFYGQLKEFAAENNRTIFTSTVNQTFADGLVEYYRVKGLMDSSIKKNLDLLKWFMNWCLREGLIYDRDFEHISFSPVKPVIGKSDIYLKWEELISLHSCLSLTKKEEWCRDIFCFISFTGMRFSTINRLKKQSIAGDYILEPGEKEQKVLMNRFSLEICRKYENRYYRNNTLFPALSLITFHKHLRSAALKAGLNRQVHLPSPDKSPKALNNKISSQIAINTYFAVRVRLGIHDSLVFNNKSYTIKSRVLAHSGALRHVEENHLATSNQLYESIRSSGARS